MSPHESAKRLGFVLSLAALLTLSVAGRLFQKSIIEHESSVKAAEHQYAFRHEISGGRGEIVVANGENRFFALAQNERRYQVLAVPLNIKDAQKTADALAGLIDVPSEKIFNIINNKKLYVPPLKRRLTRTEANNVAALKLEGVLLLPESIRIYPENNLASQVIGFVNAENNGNYGIEGTFDSVLKGAAGYVVGEKDNHGNLIAVNDEVEAREGKTIVLTLDRDIQHFVELVLNDALKKYEADSGSIVVVNPKTGAIVAMAGAPSFNPNEFNTVDDQAKFLNRAISAVWEPGSVAKPLIMALAIDNGLVEPDTKGIFGASVVVGNHEIFTAEKKAYGEETMTQVLENSDNVAMVWVADKLGNEAQRDGLARFGIGEIPQFNLGATVSGHLPPVKNWSPIARANMAFGQGFSATPLQMVMAYAALANNGVLMQPHIVAEVRDEQGVLAKTEPKEVRQVVKSETAAKLLTMLESVVNNGHAKRAGVAGYRIGGKTGTAQVPNPDGGYFDDRHIGSLLSCFPISDPKYCTLVKLDQPKNVKFAESSAGPVNGEINKFIAIHKQIRPDK